MRGVNEKVNWLLEALRGIELVFKDNDDTLRVAAIHSGLYRDVTVDWRVISNAVSPEVILVMGKAKSAGVIVDFPSHVVIPEWSLVRRCTTTDDLEALRSDLEERSSSNRLREAFSLVRTESIAKSEPGKREQVKRWLANIEKLILSF